RLVLRKSEEQEGRPECHEQVQQRGRIFCRVKKRKKREQRCVLLSPGYWISIGVDKPDDREKRDGAGAEIDQKASSALCRERLSVKHAQAIAQGHSSNPGYERVGYEHPTVTAEWKIILVVKQCPKERADPCAWKMYTVQKVVSEHQYQARNQNGL